MLYGDWNAFEGAFFPEFDPELWETVSTEHHEPDERNTLPYTFAEYRRKRG